MNVTHFRFFVLSGRDVNFPTAMTKAKPRVLAPSSAWVQRYLQEHQLSTLISDGINEVFE
jgi:hypothetical protein